MEQFINIEAITLAAAITSTSATSITLSSVSGLPSSGTCRLKIDSEYMICTLNGTTTVTVTRGAESSTASTHSSGVAVSFVLTAGALNQFRSDNVQYGTTANRPAAGAAGRIYRCTDSPFTCYDNGTSWDLYHGNTAYLCTPPVVSGFTAYGSASNSEMPLTSAGDATLMTCTLSTSSTHNYGGIYVLPITSGDSWTLTFGADYYITPSCNAFTCPVLFESSTGKTCFTGVQYYPNNPQPSISNLSLTVSGVGSTYNSNDGDVIYPSNWVKYLRIVYTSPNTFATLFISPDGLIWMPTATIYWDVFFTTAPDHIGFGIDPITVSPDNVSMLIYHWNFNQTS